MVALRFAEVVVVVKAEPLEVEALVLAHLAEVAVLWCARFDHGESAEGRQGAQRSEHS